MKKKYLLLLIIIGGVVGSISAQIQFQEIANEIGINELGLNHGVSIVDIDQDGWDDIYIVKKLGPNRLYKNLGNHQYKNIAKEAGLDYLGNSHLGIWGDINNDGYLDLFLGTYDNGDMLFINHGNNQFTEIGKEAGLFSEGTTIGATFADVDNDGWLDLYCARHFKENTLFRNLGQNTFEDITEKAGTKDAETSMGVLFFDYDNDNDQDLYLVRDGRLPNILYQNDGKGHFKDVAPEVGIDEQGFGMGAAVGDINHDGWLDLYVTNLFYNAFFLNNGDGTFSDISESTQTRDFGVGWGVSFFDADNDGFQDLYFTNTGYYSSGLPSLPNVFFQNKGEQRFVNISENTPLASRNDGYGMAISDLDQDGKLDLLVTNSAGPNGIELFHNQTQNDHHWAAFSLHGTRSNRAAIGARVDLKVDGIWQTQTISGGSGWASQNSLTLHFGLNKATMIDSLILKWPSGQIDSYTHLKVDRRHHFTEFVNTSPTPLASQKSIQANLYPNPCKEQFQVNIRLAEEEKIKFSLTNLTGEIIQTWPESPFTSGNHILTYATLQLSPGVYLFRLQTNEENQVIKVIVSP